MKKVKEKRLIIGKLDVLGDVKNPRDFPWPFPDESVKELTCVGVFEFIPGKMRGRFMDEVYRVLTPEGKATFAVVYWNSARSIQDFRCEWPPLCEQSFLYFNKEWRKVNNIDTDLICDFDFSYGYAVEPETAARSEETRSFNIKHYTNCVDGLHLTLTKRNATISS